MNSISSETQGQFRFTREFPEAGVKSGLRSINGAEHHRQIRYEYPASTAQGKVH